MKPLPDIIDASLKAICGSLSPNETLVNSLAQLQLLIRRRLAAPLIEKHPHCVDWKAVGKRGQLLYRLERSRLIQAEKARGAALDALLKAWPPDATTPVALKGIRLAPLLWETSWARAMGDIDILIDKTDSERLLEITAKLGWVPAQIRSPSKHHHLPPLFHPELRVFLELHTHLLPFWTYAAGEFKTADIAAQCLPCEVHPKLRRLPPAMEWRYIACHAFLSLDPNAFAAQLIDLSMHWRYYGQGPEEKPEFDSSLRLAGMACRTLQDLSLEGPPVPYRPSKPTLLIVSWLTKRWLLSSRKYGWYWSAHRQEFFWLTIINARHRRELIFNIFGVLAPSSRPPKYANLHRNWLQHMP